MTLLADRGAMASAHPPTSCVLCRAHIEPQRTRDMWSFLCGACEGMIHIADEAVFPWLRAVNELAHPMGEDEVLVGSELF